MITFLGIWMIDIYHGPRMTIATPGILAMTIDSSRTEVVVGDIAVIAHFLQHRPREREVLVQITIATRRQRARVAIASLRIVATRITFLGTIGIQGIDKVVTAFRLRAKESIAIRRDLTAGVTHLSRGRIRIHIPAFDEGAITVTALRVFQAGIAVFAHIQYLVTARFGRFTIGAATVARDHVTIVTDLPRIEDAVPAAAERNTDILIDGAPPPRRAAQTACFAQVGLGVEIAGAAQDNRRYCRDHGDAESAHRDADFSTHSMHDDLSAQWVTLTEMPSISPETAGTTSTLLAGRLAAPCSAVRGRFKYRRTTPAANNEPPAI